MSQRRVISFIESVVNVFIGFSVALVSQIVVFPLFDIAVSLVTNMQISAVFTFVSIVRSYAVRRFFNWLGGLSSNG